MLRLWTVITFCSLFSPPLRASSPLSCETLNEGWKSHFRSDFNVEWDEGTFRCPSKAAKIAKALYDVFTPRLGYDYYNWSKALVKGIKDGGSYCGTSTYAYFSEGKLNVCDSFFNDTDEARAGTIVHEAAHGRSNDPGHVLCRHGSSKGNLSCDERLYDDFGGSGYNHEFQFYWHASQVKNYPYLDKAVMLSWMKWDLLNKFNEVSDDQVQRWTARIEEGSKPSFLSLHPELNWRESQTVAESDSHHSSAAMKQGLQKAAMLKTVAADTDSEEALAVRDRLLVLAKHEPDLYVAREAVEALCRNAVDSDAILREVVKSREKEERFAFAGACLRRP